MPERTDESGSRQHDAGPPICAYCRADLDPESWHPVVTRSSEPYRLYTFCDEHCRGAWLEKRA